jgi:predicted DNA-binding transcriptional regulator YafY
LLADHDVIVKQYLLTKTVAATPTDDNFRPISQEKIEQLFRYSFGSWTGTEKHRVRLRLSSQWVTRLHGRQGLLFDEIRQEAGGRFVAEGSVNSLEELARWVVGMGKGIVVEAPQELRSLVVDIAKGVISNY